ncbi:MAG: hypothetical protein IKJ43_01525 [Bacilli bacterium]|nr:hypothetical protein [Bacilli bacterium]
MDKTIYLINLYDYYGELLTDKQREYFEDYYFNNYSLSEISENKGISRNAIHKTIKDTENKLMHFEKILKEYEKSNKIREIIKDIDEEKRKQIEDLL